MFKKSFHTKKNVNLRNSDVRKLLARIPGDSSNLVDKKSQVAHVKIVTFYDVPMNVYLFDKTPLFFDFDEKGLLFPTVYFLWKFPSIYPILVVHEPVLQYLENGADLMLQGVAKNFPVPIFNKGDVITIGLNINGQIQPVAVGNALFSSMDMVANKFQGKGIQTIHVTKDFLWDFGPRGTAPIFDLLTIYPPSSAEETEKETNGELKDENVEAVTEDLAATSLENEDQKENKEETNDEPVENLVLRCFIAGLKYRFTKKGSLPMDVGQFYTQCLLKCVPENRRLDMKKTKYKKFATFLEEMEKHPDGFVLRILKKGKGVDMIAGINWDHPLIRCFEVTDERIKDEEAPATNTKGPVITEYFAITETVLGFFNSVTRVSKGVLLTTADTRSLITQYVKTENLAEDNNVRLDPLLASLVKTNKDVVDWNTIIQNIQAKMTKTFILKMPDGRELMKKISLPKLVFKIETRSGNKKVTLLNNLSTFGINPKVICKEIQVCMATSATTQETAVMCEGPQLVIQGNQVGPIGDLLMTQYGIDKKYIVGLDLAPKKKK